MKIGILTLPLHTNYGGILQTYALQTVLERMGHEVVVFQTYYDGVRKISPKVYPLVLVKRFLKKCFINHSTPVFLESKKRRETRILRKNTDKFIERYIHCLHVNSLKEVSSNDFDAIIVGSDQIWRPEYVKRLWKTGIQDAFLRFAEGWSIKRVAYAASFGVDNWLFSHEETDECSKLVKAFDAISVREASAVKLCTDNLGVTAQHVLDPTMLLEAEDYIKLIDNANISQNSSGLFAYILDETPEKLSLVARIAHDYGMNQYSISINSKDYSKFPEDRAYPSVESWLKCFHDANFVVTDSFHGCVFSVIFRKPFIAIGNTGRGMARFNSFLGMLNFGGNMVDERQNIIPQIDNRIYEEAQLIIDKYRDDGMRYLKESL